MDQDMKKEPLTDDMPAPPAYAYTMEGATCTQPPMPAPLTAPVVRGEGWSPTVFAMSLCSVVCCGVFGIAATAMSIMAYVDHKFNDVRMVTHRQRKAKIFLTCAILVGMILLSLIMVRAYLDREHHMDDDDHHGNRIQSMHHQNGGNHGMHHGSYGSHEDMGGMRNDMMHDQ